MEYKNQRTGVVIDTPCVVWGGDWVKVSDLKPEVKTVVPNDTVVNNHVVEVEPQVEAEPEENTIDFDGITLKQIKQELDAFGVEYDQRANKQTLYDLMLAQGK